MVIFLVYITIKKNPMHNDDQKHRIRTPQVQSCCIEAFSAFAMGNIGMVRTNRGFCS